MNILRGPVYSAVMGVVKNKIADAESAFLVAKSANQTDYNVAVEREKALLEQKNSVALGNAVESVLKGLV